MPSSILTFLKVKSRKKSVKRWQEKNPDLSEKEVDAFIKGFNMGWKKRHRLIGDSAIEIPLVDSNYSNFPYRFVCELEFNDGSITTINLTFKQIINGMLANLSVARVISIEMIHLLKEESIDKEVKE